MGGGEITAIKIVEFPTETLRQTITDRWIIVLNTGFGFLGMDRNPNLLFKGSFID